VHNNPSCNGGVISSDVHTTSLGAGPEVYNNMDASHNCVGGSETSCIPDSPPVGDASKTGMGSTLPSPSHWYANGDGVVMKTSQALAAVPIAGANIEAKKSVANATPGHIMMATHAVTLAAIQGVIRGDFIKGDFSQFQKNAVKNAESVTPVGAFMIRKISV